MASVRDNDYLLINRDGVDYKTPASSLNIPKLLSQLGNDTGFITLDQVPEVSLEGSLIFRGTVENEAALPGDAAQGDLYYNEEDEHLYAKGESEWYKLNTVDDIKVDVTSVLASGNLASEGQSLRFRLSGDPQPNIDVINPNPILLEDGIGSAHRALASSYTTHVEGVGAFHTDINSSYLASYILDEDLDPDGMSKLSPQGIDCYVKPDVSWSGEEWGFTANVSQFSYNRTFTSTPSGEVKAASFEGDGSKLTNLPIPEPKAISDYEDLPE